jgi:hypothetical protein
MACRPSTARRLRWGVLAALGSGIVLPTLVSAAVLVLAVPSPAGLAVSALAAGMPVPRFASVILGLDRHEREPPWLLAAAFAWGTVVAFGLAVAVNTAVEILMLPPLGAGWTRRLGAPWSVVVLLLPGVWALLGVLAFGWRRALAPGAWTPAQYREAIARARQRLAAGGVPIAAPPPA